ILNVLEIEQNTCILPAENTGTQCFVFDEDTNGNYANNDQLYANDCEASSTSFNQIGYHVIHGTSINLGPTNRCENVYNCYEFPVDGNSFGFHLLDPYLSVSAQTLVKPNEPQTAGVAIDNYNSNWLPPMAFGMNDLAGRNRLGAPD